MACRSCRSSRPNINDNASRRNALPAKEPIYFVGETNYGKDLNAARKASFDQQKPVIQKWS